MEESLKKSPVLVQLRKGPLPLGRIRVWTLCPLPLGALEPILHVFAPFMFSFPHYSGTFAIKNHSFSQNIVRAMEHINVVPERSGTPAKRSNLNQSTCLKSSVKMNYFGMVCII